MHQHRATYMIGPPGWRNHGKAKILVQMYPMLPADGEAGRIAAAPIGNVMISLAEQTGLFLGPASAALLLAVSEPRAVFFMGAVLTDIKSIPKELDESAAMDGCSYPRFVWSVLIPLYCSA